MFEVSGVEESVAKEGLRLASAKLPMRTKVISKAQSEGGDV
jgi:large subunit ribosomal protein L16